MSLLGVVFVSITGESRIFVFATVVVLVVVVFVKVVVGKLHSSDSFGDRE